MLLLILDQRVILVSDCFLPLLPASRMIDSLLYRPWFVLVVGIDVFLASFAMRTRGVLSKFSSANFVEVSMPLFDLADVLCVDVVPPVASTISSP